MSRRAVTCLRPKAAKALAEGAARIWRHNDPGLLSEAQIDYMLASRNHPQLIRQTLARGDHWDVVRDGEALVAFAHSFHLEGGAVKLDKLYVHPDWQHRGLGAMLVERIKTRARAHGRSHLLLRVNRRNAQAIAAYRKYVFVVVREVVEDIGGGFVMDDYLMIKALL